MRGVRLICAFVCGALVVLAGDSTDRRPHDTGRTITGPCNSPAGTAPQGNDIAAADHALDAGDPRQAAAGFARALDACLQAGVSGRKLVRLRVALATALMESEDNRQAEAVLADAQKQVAQPPDRVARAELLNAWSALHSARGQLSAAEAELKEAWQITAPSEGRQDLRPTILHNLAAVEMRTRRYPEALDHEEQALRLLESDPSPDRRKLMRAWASLASLYYMMGRPQEARSSMERALGCAEKIYGPRSAILADLLDSDAIILDHLKAKKQAKYERTRARQIRGAVAHPADDRPTWNVHEISEGPVYLRSKY